jgi:hypothetical protein
MADKIDLLRSAMERAAANDEKLVVRDADPERNGNAYEGGFTAFLTGSRARAELHVGNFIAEVLFTEYGNGSSLHPVPEFKQNVEDEDSADVVVATVLERLRGHINRNA